MGTTLTGTTPQDTYDSLIKVTDNAPLTGSLKVLTDGLGNDSALALSTGAASVTGTLAVSGNATFDTNTLFVDAANNRVGVGTAAPISKIDVIDGTINVGNSTNVTQTNNLLQGYGYILAGAPIGITRIASSYSNVNNSASLEFYTDPNGATPTERMRITATGNVGIGISAPTTKLYVQGSIAGASPAALLRIGNNGSGFAARITLTDETTNDGNIVFQGGNSAATQHIGFGLGSSFDTLKLTGDNFLRLASATGGIQFNGDTAAANALDDYEEGTWTPVLRGAATAGTYELSTSNAVYTKIGRQVTVSCEIVLAAVITGGGTTYAQITGLPFAKGAGQQAVGSVFLSGVDFTADYVVVNFTSSAPTSVVYFSEVRDNALGGDLPIAGFSATDTVFFTITYNA